MQTEEYKKIITMAIGNEIAAYEFYQAVSDATKDDNLKRLFRTLAQDEQGHRRLLEGCLSASTPMKFKAAPDYKVSQTIEKPRLSLSMKPVEAMALAVKEEEEAMLMYRALADASDGAEQKDLFQNLAGMEQGHKVRLEEIYTSMAFPEAW